MSAEEKLNQVAGSIKEGFGKLTGDKKLESEGAIEGVKNIFKKD